MKFTVTLWGRVADPAALAEAAAKIAVNSMTAEEWRAMRQEHPGGEIEADLIMLLDPGSGNGLEIEETTAMTSAGELLG